MTKATTRSTSTATEPDEEAAATPAEAEEGQSLGEPAAPPEPPVQATAGEDIDSSAYEELEGGEKIVRLLKDVEETFYYPGTTRPSTRLLYTKGQLVKLSDIEGRTS